MYTATFSFFCLTFTFQLLDNLWSPSPPRYVPSVFIARIGFSIPTARRLQSNAAATDYTAEGTTNILIDRYLWECRARTTASSVAQSFLMPSASLLAFGKLQPAPTTQMTLVGWSV